MANRLGKYQLIAEIARGGMGIVHLAVAHGPARFSKLLVIKQLKPDYADDETVLEMFLEEARLAARLNHPNIVQTHEVGQEDRHHYLVMDYLDGVTLAKVLRRRSPRFTVNMRLRVLCEVLQALEYAHTLKDFDGSDLGIVHRDVNPLNVFITFDGQTKLVDFGIAKALDSTIETRTGILKGKPAYMSPEQISGEVDPRADIFSVGVMMWEAAAGKRMWPGKGDVEVLGHMLKGEIPSIREAAPETPEALAQIIDEALATDRDRRYSSARALQDVLEQYLRGDETATMRAVGELVCGLFVEDRKDRQGKIDAQLALLKSMSSSGPPSASSSADGTPAFLPMLGSVSGPPSGGSHSAPPAMTRTPSSTSESAPLSVPAEAKPRRKVPILIVVIALLLTAFTFLVGLRATKSAATAAGSTAAPPDTAGPPATGSTAPPASTGPTADAKTEPPPAASSPPPPTTGKPKIAAPTRPAWTPPRPAPPVRPPTPTADARAPTPPPSSSASCNPPFYYDGEKKVFKAGCL